MITIKLLNCQKVRRAFGKVVKISLCVYLIMPNSVW